MSFAKGAFSRHVLRRSVKKQRVSMFGSRHAYRRNKRSMGGRGASY